MFKKLFFIVIIAANQLGAMDRASKGMSSSSNEATGSQNQRDAALVHSCNARIELEIVQSEAEQNRAWNRLIQCACHVLQKGSALEQHRLFGDVLEQTHKSLRQVVILEKPLQISRLLNMALYFRHKQLMTDPSLVWQSLCECKIRIDGLKFHDMTAEDRALVACLFKQRALNGNIAKLPKKFVMITHQHPCSRNNACFSNDVMCATCKENVQAFVDGVMLSSCCRDEYAEKSLCERCGLKLQGTLVRYLRGLVLGFHQFGYPLKDAEHKALVKWAIMFESSKKK